LRKSIGSAKADDGTIEIEQTKEPETHMNRSKLTTAVFRNASGVKRNGGYLIGSCAGSKHGTPASSNNTLRRRVRRLAFE
jgi:hypothetical protein